MTSTILPKTKKKTLVIGLMGPSQFAPADALEAV